MAGVGKPLHLRLFLEGQEVPVVSAQVQFGLWAPATAAIQIVPIDEGLEFKARTMVHLFYLEEPKSSIKAGEVRRENITLGLNGAMGDSAYKLFFAGEIAGFSFVKTPMSRAIVLQCMDFSSYWDSVQATMMDYGPQGNAMVNKAAVYGSDSSVFANVPSMNQAEKLRSWILGHAKTKGLDTVGGLAGGILNMVETMGGIRGSVLGVNDFFTIAELRCHILSQIVAEEGDDTSKRLLDVSVFFDFIHNNFQNQPGQVTLRDMMKMLCAYIYYSFVPNPVAKFEAGDGKKKITYGPKDIALSSHRNFGACMAVITEATRVFPMTSRGTTDSTAAVALGSDIAKTLVPKLKQMQKEVSIDQSLVIKAEQLGQEVTRFNGLSEQPASSVAEARGRVAAMSNTLWDQFSAASKTPVRQPGGSYTIDSASRLKAHVFRPDCFMAAPPTCNVIFPEQYSQISYDRAFLTEVTRVEVSVFNHVVGQDALTAAHFVEPHMLDMSKAVVAQMSHKWRVLMDHERHTGIIAREEWLPDSFSSLRQPKGETAAKLKQASTSWTQKTGLHHFFKYRIGPRTMNVAGRFMPQVVCGFPALIIQKPFYLPNSTVSNIPQDQAIDRILKSSNPAVELGAPPQFLGMVEGVSHSLSQDGGNSSLSLSHCRSHLGIDDEFIGSVLDKVKSQTTTKTLVRYTVTYEQAKKDGKLKQFLLGCTPQSLPAESQMTVVERKVTSSEAQFIHTTAVGGKKSSTKKTVNVKTSTEKSVKKTVNGSTTSAPDPHSSVGATIHVPAQNGTVTVGSKGMRGGTVKLIEVLAPYDIVEEESKGVVAGTEWTAPEAVGAFGGRSDVPATPAYTGPKWRFFRGVTVFEEIALTTSEITPVPVEYVVQPAWMSTSYDNENIGPKIYQPFFGCPSIVDAISLSNTNSERVGESGAYASPYEDDAALRARLQDTHNKRNFYSIEKAANLIAYLYGKVKSGKADVSEFVDSYTWRKVATKLELLGSYDLEIGFKKDVPFAKSGKLGFHTLSVHPEVVKKGKLIGLLDDPTWKGTRMNGSQKSAVAASYDVRAEKLAKVEKYIQVLKDGARGHVG